jgi:GNAT superfamily N-acetyltransferase
MQTLVREPLRLADTRRVWLRPLAAEDAPRLMDLCQRVSPESRRRRFLRSTVRCDAAEAERLAAVDQMERVAVAVVPSLASDAPIVAVGRFHTEGSERAELALLVDDAYQHIGLGRLLLNRLADEAYRHGLRVLEGHVLYDNRPMLHLLRTTGLPVQVRWDGGDVLSVELQVGQPAAVRQPVREPDHSRSAMTRSA